MCASKLSPSSSTAAIPPCAQPVAPSPSAPLAITATLRVSARLSAAVSPAAPEPTIEDVGGRAHARPARCVRLRNTSSRSGSRVDTSTIASPSRWQRGEHLAGVDLVLAEGDLDRPLVEQRDVLEAGVGRNLDDVAVEGRRRPLSPAPWRPARGSARWRSTRPWLMIAMRSHSSSASSR